MALLNHQKIEKDFDKCFEKLYAGEGVDALACLAGLAPLGHELADAVEGENLALLHLVVDQLEEGLVHLLASLALDTFEQQNWKC